MLAQKARKPIPLPGNGYSAPYTGRTACPNKRQYFIFELTLTLTIDLAKKVC